MARTKFNPENATFSSQAHLAARKLIYPSLFQCPQERLSYEDVSSFCPFDTHSESPCQTDKTLDISARNHILDQELRIDKIIHVETGLHHPLIFTIQERFRRSIYRNYKDLTITEWNYASNTPSELYKITAGLLVYGYYDEEKEIFLDAIAIGVTSFLLAISKNKLKYEIRQNSKQQTFLACRFQDMIEMGIVYWRQNSGESGCRKPAGEGVVSTHRHKPASGVGELTPGVGELTTAFSGIMEKIIHAQEKTPNGIPV